MALSLMKPCPTEQAFTVVVMTAASSRYSTGHSQRDPITGITYQDYISRVSGPERNVSVLKRKRRKNGEGEV